MLADLARDGGAALAYSAIGIALIALGFVLVDVITPGNLRHQIWVDRNPNAALLAASNVLGVGIIVAMAIWTSEGSIGRALAASVVYGLIGLAVMAIAFVLLDLLTPGKLGELLVDDSAGRNPAVWVSAALHIAVALVVAAGLS
ncbi:DUF350 domain-containing protein [Nocardia sp. XZ_19_385]|uniref:DUF350 domain-containing protein n=1 Tax=Nocardia sp. XZ_19_385 TaxID=2769488 RepID=UPI00188E81F0|nr:DUF350 domain-containing protein [Nocardia sp. XZ_19_385]